MFVCRPGKDLRVSQARKSGFVRSCEIDQRFTPLYTGDDRPPKIGVSLELEFHAVTSVSSSIIAASSFWYRRG